jgi:hypothetical protein
MGSIRATAGPGYGPKFFAACVSSLSLLDSGGLLYYNITANVRGLPSMSAVAQVTHRHTHAVVAPSILRLSAWQRLAVVAVLVLALWGAVLWAMT